MKFVVTVIQYYQNLTMLNSVLIFLVVASQIKKNSQSISPNFFKIQNLSNSNSSFYLFQINPLFSSLSFQTLSLTRINVLIHQTLSFHILWVPFANTLRSNTPPK
eukprot:TRINITY_DN4630_c0_g1_i1.p2 TRINITY_DN4630_c0_g1~~TRINITY_DN4630_c0_g1_i1.p2  ORF type:complete len:105 (-),score=8.01 TRINITY_DN4630_c0_g1_i1:77-391(-)